MAIAFGLLFMVVTVMDRFDEDFRYYMLRQYVISFIIVADLSLWVFLTCLFIPSNKRVAGIIPAIFIFALSSYAIWSAFKTRSITNQTLLTGQLYFIAGMVISPFLGYGLSYFIFKDKGWKRIKNQVPEKDLAEIYEEETSRNANPS